MKKQFRGLSKKEIDKQQSLPREFIIENWKPTELKAVIKSLNKQILVLMKKDAEEVKQGEINLLIMEKSFYQAEMKKRK